MVINDVVAAGIMMIGVRDPEIHATYIVTGLGPYFSSTKILLLAKK